MSEYEPGTVAVATVRGRENVRVFCDDWDSWRHADIIGFHHTRSTFVTDIRPLVVLDLDDYSGERAVNYLRNLARESRDVCGNSPSPRGKLALFIADQIEAQTKPPRISEPGLWGVVEATVTFEGTTYSTSLVRHPGPSVARCWLDQSGTWWDWDSLVDPTLIREGLS